jgi:hypothetical protein
VPLATVAVFWATVLGLVVVPGVLLCRGGRLCPDEPWFVLGQGASLGLALHGLGLLAGRRLGAPWLPLAIAVAAVAIGLALGARPRPDEPSRRPPAAAGGLTLLVALAACLLQPLASVRNLGEPVPVDLLFHTGNAAELRHHWPPQDPRTAGLPLNYPLLSYALPAEAAERAGAPVADVLLGLAPLLWVSLLTLQLANAGRALSFDGAASALGAAVVVLHADPGRLLGLGDAAFSSYLGTGVYGSPTTVVGLLLLAGLTVALAGWLEAGPARALVPTAVLAAAASAAKATVLPAVAGGLGLVGAVGLFRGGREAGRRAAVAMAVVCAAGLPATWQLFAGTSSYRGVIRWDPGAVFATSPFAAAARTWADLIPGEPLGALAMPLFAAWLAGYLALAGAAFVAWCLARGGVSSVAQRWALAAAAAGGGLALVLHTPDSSELFFAYDAQLLLAPFAGAGLVLVAGRRWRAGPAIAALALCALPSADLALRTVPGTLREDLAASGRRPSPMARQYLDGLAWLRAHGSGDVVFADNPAFILSALGEVRLYYENALFTPRGWESRWEGLSEPFPERRDLQERLLRRPDAPGVQAARQAVGEGPRLLVVADSVPSDIESGFVRVAPGAVPPHRLFPPELFALRFANAAMHVYEAIEGGPGQAGPG